LVGFLALVRKGIITRKQLPCIVAVKPFFLRESMPPKSPDRTATAQQLRQIGRSANRQVAELHRQFIHRPEVGGYEDKAG